MADTNDILGDEELDRMLGQLSSEVPAPSDALMSRILADAEELRPVPGSMVAREPEGFLGSFLALLGGWKGASGLMTAGIVGLWVGISPPTMLETTTSELWEILNPDLTGGWSDYRDFL